MLSAFKKEKWELETLGDTFNPFSCRSNSTSNEEFNESSKLISEVYSRDINTPEGKLWSAVLEEAFKSYRVICKRQKVSSNKIYVRTPTDTYFYSSIESLESFFFDHSSTLSEICIILDLDVATIRKEALKIKKS